MSWLHTWVGLLAGWILYAMFITGSVSYFREELTQWMQPEIPALTDRPDALAIAQRGINTLQVVAPDNPQWTIDLPGLRSNAAYAMWLNNDGFERVAFNPLNGNILAPRDTAGGEFFYYFHFSLHYLPRAIGRWLTGLSAMFMLVAIVTGLIIHKKIFTDFFTFRRGKGQRSWLDAHNTFSVLGLPFHLMITYSGLIMLMFMYMPWGRDAALPTAQERAAMTAEMRALLTPHTRSGQAMATGELNTIFSVADQRWGTNNIERVVISNPGDSTARIMLVRGNAGRVSVSPQYLIFDAKTQQPLHIKEQASAAVESWGVMYGLHMGRFADSVTRWLYFIVSLAGTAMVATGLILWTIKRRQKLQPFASAPLGLRLLEHGNVACIAGLSIAMTAYLWGNRLLPVELTQRTGLEIDLFFIVWGMTFLHACCRPVKQAWREQLWIAATLLALLPLIDVMSNPHSMFTWFDLSAVAMAVLHAAVAYKMKKAKH